MEACTIPYLHLWRGKILQSLDSMWVEWVKASLLSGQILQYYEDRSLKQMNKKKQNAHYCHLNHTFKSCCLATFCCSSFDASKFLLGSVFVVVDNYFSYVASLQMKSTDEKLIGCLSAACYLIASKFVDDEVSISGIFFNTLFRIFTIILFAIQHITSKRYLQAGQI